MKRILYALCVVFTVVFTSCNQDEFDTVATGEAVTLTVSVDEGVMPRSTDPTVDRYVIEVYTDNACTVAANVFPDGKNSAVNSTGAFSMILDRSKAYYCLLWADKGASTSYTVSNLKAVELVSGQKAAEAWHGKVTIEAGTTAALSAVLKRAVSTLSLLETGVVMEHSALTLTFQQPTQFNVLAATASNLGSFSETIDLSAGASGSVVAPVKLNPTNLYVLASAAAAIVTDLTFTMATNERAEPSFEVANVPLQANYMTNIKGHYTNLTSTAFSVSVSNTWRSYDE